MTKLVISIAIGFTIPLLVLAVLRIVKLFLMSRVEIVRRELRGGLVNYRTTETCTSTTSTSSTDPPYEEGDYCDAEYGGVVSGRVAPRECRNFQNIVRGIAHAGFTTRQAAEALAAMGRAGASAGREFNRMVQQLNGGIVSEYNMGYVDRIIITMSDGNEVSIDNPRVEVYIDQETLDHTSLGSDGLRNRRSVVVNEDRRVRVGVGAETFFNTIRLIRED